MAIKQFTASLNGGDAVTSNQNLIYKIYGSADSYTTAIATTGSHVTDSDVTVTGDVVVITNVDVGVEDSFKISSIDEVGNEAPLSDAFGLNYGLSGTQVQSQMVNGTLSTSASTSDGGDIEIEVRVKLNSGNTKNNVALGVGSRSLTNFRYGIAVATQINGTQVAFYTGDGTNYDTQLVNIPDFTNFHIYKIIALSDGSWEAFLDGVSVGTGTTTLGQLPPNQNLVYILQSGYSGSLVSSINGTIDWCKVNGEVFDLNEGTGITTTSDGGTVCTLSNPLGGALPQWEAL